MTMSSFAYARDDYVDAHLSCVYQSGNILDKLQVVLKIAKCEKPTCKVAMVLDDESHLLPQNISTNVQVSHDYYRWENSIGTKFALNRLSGELIFGKKDGALGPYICTPQQQKF